MSDVLDRIKQAAQRQAELDAAPIVVAKGPDDFADYLKEAVKEAAAKPFTPAAWYNLPGDLLEVYWSREASYSEWLKTMDVCLSRDTEKPVGVNVYSIRQLVEASGCVVLLPQEAVELSRLLCGEPPPGEEHADG